MRNFAPITLLTSVPNVLVVHPAVPARNVRELIAHTKSQPGIETGIDCERCDAIPAVYRLLSVQ
jgi:tripartite-type tricarboxylate transporter receptor subunit TctC